MRLFLFINIFYHIMLSTERRFLYRNEGCKTHSIMESRFSIKKSDYLYGMCLLFAFHFGARRMLHMDDNLAMRDTMELSTVKGSLILNKFNDIYSMYQKGYGNFKDEVVNIATLYEPYHIADSLHFQVTCRKCVQLLLR